MPTKEKKAFIATGIMGAVAFDENGSVLDKELFQKDARTIAEKLELSRKGTLIEEEQTLIDRLNEKGYVSTKEEGSIAESKMRDEFRSIALSLRWAGSHAEINQLLGAVGAASAKPKLQETKGDRILMSAIGVADELDRVINVFVERLREWYGLHSPEAEHNIKDHEEFARLVVSGGREEGSAGMDFSEQDTEQVKAFAAEILSLFEMRKGMYFYIESAARQFAPNTAAVAGSALALRLLVLAGGLDKLAKMPSSTVQLLGAEKALFRHLKGQGRSPKHGILFSHDLVQKAPHDIRGKVARLVAAKIAIAARVDFFSKDDRGAKMRAELEEQVGNAGGA